MGATTGGSVSNDEIVSLRVNAQTVTPQSAQDVSSFITLNSGEAITLGFKRGGVLGEVAVTPIGGLITSSPEIPAIGIGMGSVGTLQLPVHLAIWEGGKQTIEMLYRITIGIGVFLSDALLLRADLSTVAGPVGIVSLVGDASALGLIALLNFTALISLNLAVINLIPFPRHPRHIGRDSLSLCLD